MCPMFKPKHLIVNPVQTETSNNPDDGSDVQNVNENNILWKLHINNIYN